MDNHGQYFKGSESSFSLLQFFLLVFFFFCAVSDPDVQRADEYFALAVEGGKEEVSSKAMCLYALFLEKKRDYVPAEGNFWDENEDKEKKNLTKKKKKKKKNTT